MTTPADYSFFSKDDAAAGESCVIAQASLLTNTVWKLYALNSSFACRIAFSFPFADFKRFTYGKNDSKSFLLASMSCLLG